jgi:hypothetical protein
MIARSGRPFTLRNFFDRFDLVSIRQRLGRYYRSRLKGWQRFLPNLAGPSEVLLRDRSEQFRRFCHDCQEDTAHRGYDELGIGWYAQVSHCRQCGRQSMRVWLIG